MNLQGQNHLATKQPLPTNPITLETDGGSTTLKFKESDTTHGTIEFRTADIADGDLRILANRVALKTSAGTDAVSISTQWRQLRCLNALLRPQQTTNSSAKPI